MSEGDWATYDAMDLNDLQNNGNQPNCSWNFQALPIAEKL